MARKLIVREITGYGTRPDGKGLVLAMAWGVSLRTLGDLLSLTSDRPISATHLDRMPEPERSMVLAMEREIAALGDAELAAWVDARRPVRRVAA